jgi:tetratricopeptide (TPR) repeat protein
MAQKKKKKPLKRPGRSGKRDMEAALKRLVGLMERKQVIEARALLERLIDDYPNRPEIYQLAADVAIGLGDHKLGLFACERLRALVPHDRELPFLLALAYLGNGLPALAVAAGRRALATERTSRKAAMVRDLVARFEPVVLEQAASFGFDGPDGLQCLEMHEQARALVVQGKFREAHAMAERLIAKQPRFAPAYNNGADACYHEGKIAAAVTLTERVLAFAPINIFALSNLVRFLAASGKMTEARRHAERLKQLEPTMPDQALKQAEALTWIGDDAGVLAAFAAAERLEAEAGADEMAGLHHLAAVAQMHLGDEGAAREHWQAALRAQPGFAVAQANLDDLKQPVGNRHAPWYCDVASIMPKNLIGGLIARMTSARGRDPDLATAAAAKGMVAAHPEVEGLVPLLLNLTESSGRQLAMMLATLVRAPAMLEAVRDFALGQRGPDALRTQAATFANEAGLLPDSPVQLWIQGEWRPVAMQRYEIHGDALKRKHAPGVFALIEKGMAALSVGDCAGAEALLRRALAIDPDDPVVLNNLAGVLAQRGRLAETEVIAERLVERHPDYLFGRTALANMASERGEVARARELLAPLLERRRFHHSEFAALSMAQLNLFLADNNLEQARICLDMWRQADPHHPALARYAKLLGR